MQKIANGAAGFEGFASEAEIKGYVAGRLGEKVPANQRLPIPYEGLERLAYWRGHRMGSEAVKARLRSSRRKFWKFTTAAG
jgi:hypothetical protein